MRSIISRLYKLLAELPDVAGKKIKIWLFNSLCVLHAVEAMSFLM